MRTKITRREECFDPLRKEKPKKGIGPIKAVVLLGTLKANPTLSNTDVLCELLAEQLKKYKISSEIIRLADYQIDPGIETHVKKKDDWPALLRKVLGSEIVIFATPIWWGAHSSLLQRVIERMDALNDELLETGISPFSNKAGGVVITGAEDGAQQVIAGLLNFMIWNGLTIPPASTLAYLGSPGDSKAAVAKSFRKEPTISMAEMMARNLNHAVNMLRAMPYPEKKGGISQDIRSGTVGMKPKG